MPRKKSSKNRTEEIRGLFVLGLLAVLSSIRVQQSEMMVDIGQISLNIIPLLDMTIALWSLYAFFMVLGLSEDVVGETISNSSRETAKAFLVLNFILLMSLSFLVFYWGFPTRLPLALGLIFIFLFYRAIKKLRKRRKSMLKLNLKKIVKSKAPSFMLLVLWMIFVANVMGIIFVPEEQLVVSYFASGLVAIIIYIVIKEKVKID